MKSYLGEQYSDEKLREVIGGIISSGADNIGAVMGVLNRGHKGKFEGKIASSIVKELLA